MDITKLAGSLLDTPFGFPLVSLANWMVGQGRLGRWLLGVAVWWLQGQPPWGAPHVHRSHSTNTAPNSPTGSATDST
jgi:hypothetical protein